MGNYKAEDWGWLIAKYEKRIGHWCNRWLSLGGRFILIKAVLESQPMYWMALLLFWFLSLTKSDKLSSLSFGRDCSEKKHYILQMGLLSKTKAFWRMGFAEYFISSIKH
jgi:hypothetical protein